MLAFSRASYRSLSVEIAQQESSGGCYAHKGRNDQIDNHFTHSTRFIYREIETCPILWLKCRLKSNGDFEILYLKINTTKLIQVGS